MNVKKCGYVALLGQPNAGKSTLMNACLGTKLAVVSAKPQTTRNKILGVCTSGDAQVVFLDTPGVHRTSGLPKINQKMNSVAWSVVSDADVLCYLVDVCEGWKEEDSVFFKKLASLASVPVLVIATKGDKLKSEVVERNLAGISEQMELCLKTLESETARLQDVRVVTRAPVLMSAKRPAEIEMFKNLLSGLVPEGPWMFEEDDLTDRPQQFVCGELIREQLFRQLGQELPYSAAVKVERFERKGQLVVIQASLIVHKENHKGMVIGARGSRIKEIGQAARLSLQRHLDAQVHLELFVKVQPNWIDSDALLAEYAGLEKMEE
ncbi:MAG: hypothetical protein RIR26_1421 [Pseudomonadota bacterium]|jgi:GTP-binding protein Era